MTDIVCTVKNEFPFAIFLTGIGGGGPTEAVDVEPVEKNEDVTVGPNSKTVVASGKERKFTVPLGAKLRAKSMLSGAFVAEKDADATSTVAFAASDLTAPNAIGGFPEPDVAKGILIPVDSERILVGVGTWIENGNGKIVVAREQCWRRCSDSYVLAPGEKRTMGITTMTGLEKSSSNESTLSAALNVGASAGWGFFSASVSASLSSSMSQSQSITISEEQTQFDTVELENIGKVKELWLRWRLVDILLLTPEGTNVVKATIESSQAPFLLSGPHTLS
jgi:hypothetical protein